MAARDTRLVAMPPDTVTRVDLFDDRRRVGLRRVDGAWTFTTPKVAYAADTRGVDEWLARLGAVRVATRRASPAWLASETGIATCGVSVTSTG